MRIDTEALEQPTGYQSRIPGLGKARARQDLTSLIEAPANAWDGGYPAVAPATWQRWRNAVVAVDPPHLLDEVLRDCHVKPEDGRQYVPLAVFERPDVEVEALENRLRLLQRHV